MTELFRTYLKAAINKEPEYIRKLAATIPAELQFDFKGKVEPVRKLLATEALESGLIQAEAHKTVLEGAQPAICMGKAMKQIPMNALTMNWVLGESGLKSSGTYSNLTAEGAELPTRTQNYSTVEFKAKKYTEKISVSNELLDDSFINVMESELRFAGNALENQKNQDAITEIIDTCSTSEHDTAGTNQGIKAIASAVSKVRAAGFTPDTLVMHPEAEALVLQEFVPTNYYPTEKIVDTGMVPNILGLKTYTCGVIDNGTEEWGYAAGGEIGMIVYDSNAVGAIGMRNDMAITQYEDPLRDSKSANLISRFDVEVFHEEACSRIEY